MSDADNLRRLATRDYPLSSRSHNLLLRAAERIEELEVGLMKIAGYGGVVGSDVVSYIGGGYYRVESRFLHMPGEIARSLLGDEDAAPGGELS